MSEGADSPYEIHWSPLVRDQLVELHRQAEQRGVEKEFLSAAQTLVARLQSNPLEAGELLYKLRGLKLEVCIAVMSPLSVSYAVHKRRRLVFVKGFKLLAG